MSEPVENKPVELNQEETKEVVGGATAIMYGLVAAGLATKIIGSVQALGTGSLTTSNGVTPTPASK